MKESEAQGSLRTQERRQGPEKARRAPDTHKHTWAEAAGNAAVTPAAVGDLCAVPGGVLLGMRTPFWAQGPGRRLEIQTETRPTAESLNTVHGIERGFENSAISRSSETCSGADRKWRHSSPGGRGCRQSFGQRELVGELPPPDPNIRPVVRGVGWGERLNTSRNLRWGEGLGCTYPFQGMRTVTP